MALIDALRGGVEVANKITRSGGMQCIVQYERELALGPTGPSWAPAVPLHALVDFKIAQVRTKEGVLTATRSIVTLLDIAEIVAATNGEGIGNNDKFTFPDGDTGPLLDISGFVDAGTGHPIATTVMIG